MRQVSRLVLLASACLLLCGCRFKGWESFTSATGPANEDQPAPYVAVKGDPYSFGSDAPATGGLKSQTNYGAGANLTSTGPINPRLDQPEMGSGQQPGNYSTAASAGHGIDNGPALQPGPSSITDTATVAHG